MIKQTLPATQLNTEHHQHIENISKTGCALGIFFGLLAFAAGVAGIYYAATYLNSPDEHQISLISASLIISIIGLVMVLSSAITLCIKPNTTESIQKDKQRIRDRQPAQTVNAHSKEARKTPLVLLEDKLDTLHTELENSLTTQEELKKKLDMMNHVLSIHEEGINENNKALAIHASEEHQSTRTEDVLKILEANEKAQALVCHAVFKNTNFDRQVLSVAMSEPFTNLIHQTAIMVTASHEKMHHHPHHYPYTSNHQGRAYYGYATSHHPAVEQAASSMPLTMHTQNQAYAASHFPQNSVNPSASRNSFNAQH